MKYVSFEDQDKIRLFDEIASHFYNSNFGMMSKADIELMMFRFYIEKLISENMNADGTIDYKKCSDYRISQDLGITQQKVRNLKVKNQLINPVKYDWKKAFATLITHARYDSQTGKVVMNIPDPNLFIEIQNFLEERGDYVEKQLNGKILQIRVQYFVELVVELEPENKRKEIIKELKKHFKTAGKEDTLFDEKHIAKSLLETSESITFVVANICSIISPENVLGMALMKLLLTQ